MLLARPFLDQPDPWDADALLNLFFLVRRPEGAAGREQLPRLPNFADGIDDAEARRLSALSAIYHQAPSASSSCSTPAASTWIPTSSKPHATTGTS